MKKALSIISAAFIAIATSGYLLIPQFYENNIKELEIANDSISQKQRSAIDDLYKANTEVNFAYVQNDFIDIFKLLGYSELYLKEDLLFKKLKSLSLHAINASLSTNQITQEAYFEKTDSLKTYKSVREFDEFYNKYMKLGGQGTIELTKMIQQNKFRIKQLEHQKNKVWFISFIFQSIGLLIGVLVIGLQENKR